MNSPTINVIPVFPTPVIVYEIKIEEKEKLFLLNQYPENIVKNIGNLTSRDRNILEREEVQGLKEKLTFLVNQAFTHIHTPLYECNLYITQSWLNFTSKDQYHHQHYHPNSFYSAVLYLKTAEEDSIVFHPPTSNNSYEIPSSHNGPHNGIFNSKSWQIPVKDNLLLIFPSTLLHSVPNVEHNNLRVSLSFNTFFKGQLGLPSGLNYLKL